MAAATTAGTKLCEVTSGRLHFFGLVTGDQLSRLFRHIHTMPRGSSLSVFEDGHAQFVTMTRYTGRSYFANFELKGELDAVELDLDQLLAEDKLAASSDDDEGESVNTPVRNNSDDSNGDGEEDDEDEDGSASNDSFVQGDNEGIDYEDGVINDDDEELAVASDASSSHRHRRHRRKAESPMRSPKRLMLRKRIVDTSDTDSDVQLVLD